MEMHTSYEIASAMLVKPALSCNKHQERYLWPARPLALSIVLPGPISTLNRLRLDTQRFRGLLHWAI